MKHEIPEDVVEVTASELRAGLRDWLERVAYEEDELVVTRAGKPMTAMITMDAFRLLRAVVSQIEDAQDIEAVHAARHEDHYVPLEKVLKGLREGA